MTSLGTLAARVLEAGQELAVGQRVQIYRNLHHGKGAIHYWSIRSARSLLVLGVVAHAILEGVELRVQEGARQTVLATGRRSVHAYALGTLRAWDEDTSPRHPPSFLRVTYNPHRGPNFTRSPKDLTPVYNAALLWFDTDGAWKKPG